MIHTPGCVVDWAVMVHVVLSTLVSCLTVWLAHRRKVADAERADFYRQVRSALEIAHPDPLEGRCSGKDLEP